MTDYAATTDLDNSPRLHPTFDEGDMFCVVFPAGDCPLFRTAPSVEDSGTDHQYELHTPGFV